MYLYLAAKWELITQCPGPDWYSEKWFVNFRICSLRWFSERPWTVEDMALTWKKLKICNHRPIHEDSHTFECSHKKAPKFKTYQWLLSKCTKLHRLLEQLLLRYKDLLHRNWYEFGNKSGRHLARTIDQACAFVWATRPHSFLLAIHLC